MSRESETELKEMKRQSLLAKAGATAGALAAIIGLGSQVGPVFLGWVLGDRDAQIKKLQEEKAVLESKVRKLEELADSAIDASEKRFQENEKHSIALRGSVESLRNEVRIRHGDMGGIPLPAVVPPSQPRRATSGSRGGGRASARLDDRPPPAPPRPPTRREALSVIKEQSDKHLSKARIAAPRSKPLRDMIKQKEKPEVIEPWD